MPLTGLSEDLAGKRKCTPSLLALLSEDAAAVSKASAELLCQGFDPLVGLQEPAMKPAQDNETQYMIHT